jgi:hypothetical protein
MIELNDIRNSVSHALREGSYLERQRTVTICRLVTLPSFGNPVGWDLLQFRHSHKEGFQSRLYRSCWRMDLDAEAFRSPVERAKYPKPFQPTIEIDYELVEMTWVESLGKDLQKCCLPLSVPNTPMGLDGTMLELVVGDSFCQARIAWWSRLPAEWKDLQPILTKLDRLIAVAWKDRGR